MKNKIFIPISIILSFFITGCVTPNPGGGGETPPVTDKGYLKIERQHSSDYFTYDYLFVSDHGYLFKAVGKNAEGKDAYFSTATWSSSNTDIFSVDSLGYVRAKSDGTATLRAEWHDYSDEIEVTVATLAAIHEVTEVQDEYRTKRVYDFPYTVTPSNALVKYYFSLENSVDVLDDNKFTAKTSGEIEVTAVVYVDEYGRSIKDKFTLNVIDNEKPYFKYQDEVTESIKKDVAIHKYKSLDFVELGITAFAGDDDSDISSQIIVKEGNYDLLQVGEYPLVLSVTNKGYETTIPFALNITEREETYTRVEHDSFDVSEVTWVIAPNQLSITFTVKVQLHKKKKKYLGEVYFKLTCEIKKSVTGERVVFEQYGSKNVDKISTSQVVSVQGTYSVSSYYIRTGEENVRIGGCRAFGNGYGFNYITYTEE